MWLPGALAVPSSHDGGSMLGSDCYVTWHTFEGPYSLTAADAARRLIAAGNEVTLTFNPVLGGVAQILPANRAARGLVNAPGGVETNRQGKIHVQIEVVAYAARPWTQDLTAAGRADLRRILSWHDVLGIPRTHPAGDQGPGPNGPFSRPLSAWNGPGGYFCHGQVPENWHWDHGTVRMTDIWAGAAASVAPSPGPAPVPVPAKPAPTPAPVAPPKVDVAAMQRAAHVTTDGTWGPSTEHALAVVHYAAWSGSANRYPWGVRALQGVLGVPADGTVGPATIAALHAAVVGIQRSLNIAADGVWGLNTEHAFGAARNTFYVHH
jgi:hypothetical protein